jgi:hypothetical protein
MHIAFICLPAAGYVNPTLPVVAELVRRGHRVTYATSAKSTRPPVNLWGLFSFRAVMIWPHSSLGGSVPPKGASPRRRCLGCLAERGRG